jgi:hypothetical protein
MPPITPPTKLTTAADLAGTHNQVVGGNTQQQWTIGPGGQQPAVIQSGAIPTTPAGTPGPASGVRYGLQFYDVNGTLRVQIDAYGWHVYTSQGVYTSALVTY